jgi:hypothetical protein
MPCVPWSQHLSVTKEEASEIARFWGCCCCAHSPFCLQKSRGSRTLALQTERASERASKREREIYTHIRSMVLTSLLNTRQSRLSLYAYVYVCLANISCENSKVMGTRTKRIPASACGRISDTVLEIYTCRCKYYTIYGTKYTWSLAAHSDRPIEHAHVELPNEVQKQVERQKRLNLKEQS